MSCATPTFLTFDLGGTPLLNIGAAYLFAFQPLYFGRGTDSALRISALLLSFVPTIFQSKALASVAAAVGFAAPSTFGG